MKSINAPRYILALLIFLAGGMLTLSCEFELPEKEAAFTCQEPAISTFYSEDASGQSFNMSLSDLQNISGFSVVFTYNGSVVKRFDDQNTGTTMFKIPVEFRTGNYAVEVEFKNECQQSISKNETKAIPAKACNVAPEVKTNFAVEGTEHYHYVDITNLKDIVNFDVVWEIDGKALKTKTGITSLSGNDRRTNVSELTGKIDVKVTFNTECNDKIPVSNLTQIPANPCKINPTVKTEFSVEGVEQYHTLSIGNLQNIASFDVLWEAGGKTLKEKKGITSLSSADSRTNVSKITGDLKVKLTYRTNCGATIEDSKTDKIPDSPCNADPGIGWNQDINGFIVVDSRLYHGYYVDKGKLQNIVSYVAVIKNNGEIIKTFSRAATDPDTDLVHDITNRTGEISIDVTFKTTCGAEIERTNTKKIPLYIPVRQIGGGSFNIGGTEGFVNETPKRLITVSNFAIGTYEVNVGQWNEVMGGQIANQWASPSDENIYRMMPVVNVSWDDCQAFINKLNNNVLLRFKPDRLYRLPTEAEWEYAAGGGNGTRTRFGNGTDFLKVGEAIYDASQIYQYAQSGSKPSRPSFSNDGTKSSKLGLYNMSGNVLEWCQDYYSSTYYSNLSTTNPKGPANGQFRVTRGGDFFSSGYLTRVSFRNFQEPDKKFIAVGFRLAHD